MSTTNPKYIFLDIDGTLVNFRAEIPSSTLTALHRAHESGHKIFIASGRCYGMIYPWLLRAFPFDGIIASGGAQVILNGACIYESIFSKDDLTFVSDYFKRVGGHFQVYTSDGMLAEQDFHTHVIPYMYTVGYDKELVDATYGGVRIVDDIRKCTNAEKCSYFLAPYPPEKISADLDGRFYVTDYSVGVATGNHYFGEMNLAGVTKASGIQAVLDAQGACVTDTIAIGDSGNDLEMLRFAGTAVAMGNGTESVKAIADLVTTHIDDNGIYNAFVKLGLI